MRRPAARQPPEADQPDVNLEPAAAEEPAAPIAAPASCRIRRRESAAGIGGE